jgi:hypothetical protein
LLPAPVQALAEPRLARWLAGAKVTVADISEASAAQTVDLIRRAGGVAQACCGDVTKADYAEWLVAATEAFGRLDLAHNARALNAQPPPWRGA